MAASEYPKTIAGLIAVLFLTASGGGVFYFYPEYFGTDRCQANGDYGTWENVSELVYFNDTFPAIGRYYCGIEAEISPEECLILDNLLNVKGCKWGGKTSRSKKTLYVMEDPPLTTQGDSLSIINLTNCKNNDCPETNTTPDTGMFTLDTKLINLVGSGNQGVTDDGEYLYEIGNTYIKKYHFNGTLVETQSDITDAYCMSGNSPGGAFYKDGFIYTGLFAGDSPTSIGHVAKIETENLTCVELINISGYNYYSVNPVFYLNGMWHVGETGDNSANKKIYQFADDWSYIGVAKTFSNTMIGLQGAEVYKDRVYFNNHNGRDIYVYEYVDDVFTEVYTYDTGSSYWLFEGITENDCVWYIYDGTLSGSKRGIYNATLSESANGEEVLCSSDNCNKCGYEISTESSNYSMEFNNFGNCTFSHHTNNDTIDIVCDSYLDSNHDGKCTSGESCCYFSCNTTSCDFSGDNCDLNKHLQSINQSVVVK